MAVNVIQKVRKDDYKFSVQPMNQSRPEIPNTTFSKLLCTPSGSKVSLGAVCPCLDEVSLRACTAALILPCLHQKSPRTCLNNK